MQVTRQTPQIEESQLADAFTAFIGAANRLEDSHRQLHEEVAELRRQLEERNRALASSVAETERMRAMLRQILDASPCGVAVLETENEEVILLNPEARRLFNAAEPAEWGSLPGCVQAAVKNICREPWEHYEQEVTVDNDGRRLCLSIRYSRMTSPVRDSGRRNSKAESSCLVLIIGDVTAQKDMERQRENSRNVVALAEMATVLAHEIRNPLGSLELLTGCLAGDPGLGDDSKRCVQHLRAGVRSLSATVNNVLCFHNPAAQEMGPLELGSALRGAVEFILPLAQQKGVQLRLRETLQDAQIAGNFSGLRQILLNLACNALRHTPLGGQIDISAGIEVGEIGRSAVIEFADTGCGIEPKNLPHIFEMGFTTTGQTPGLGLAVCQRIVEQHRGTIKVQSRLGRGTTFRMEFPVL
ncbi:MAG: ATP-binding protein [Terriglobales bacterium]|jgi:two-component system sensor histidine kinase FlrB